MTEVSAILLELNALKVDCIIGDRPEEREREQSLILDVEMELDSTVAYSDSLNDTVDYVALSESITTRLKQEKCFMIERAAFVAAQACLEYGVVRSARVKVRKSGTVDGLSSATAAVKLKRTEEVGGECA